ncbi:hemolysin activation protein, partial [Bifidobacteriaceae bacterium WP022]
FITEPPLRILRKFIPPTRCGNISIDVSYMLLYFALYVLQIWL